MKFLEAFLQRILNRNFPLTMTKLKPRLLDAISKLKKETTKKINTRFIKFYSEQNKALFIQTIITLFHTILFQH